MKNIRFVVVIVFGAEIRKGDGEEFIGRVSSGNVLVFVWVIGLRRVSLFYVL